MGRPLSVRLRKTLKRLRPQKEPELVSVADQMAGPGREQSIPRVVYQTAESRSVHPTHAKSIAEFRGLNPDLAFHMFDGAERDTYMHSTWSGHGILDVYERAVFGQMKADIFRYCVVFDRGGYYVDFNKGCATPLTSLHPPEAEGLVSYETNPELIFPETSLVTELQNPFNLVMQWAFGFRKNHPFLEKLIERIVEIEPFFRDKVFRHPKSALLTMSAPGIFTSVFRDYVKEFGTGSITEAGEDFYGQGIFRLRGSKFLRDDKAYYGKLSERPIVLSQKKPVDPSDG